MSMRKAAAKAHARSALSQWRRNGCVGRQEHDLRSRQDAECLDLVRVWAPVVEQRVQRVPEGDPGDHEQHAVDQERAQELRQAAVLHPCERSSTTISIDAPIASALSPS